MEVKIFMESILLICPERAFNRVSMISSFCENAENKMCNQTLAVTSSYTEKK